MTDSRKRRPRAYGDESRELIIDAARRLFAARGVGDVSTADIAKEAGVARATVFNQFGSKALVLDAIAAQTLATYRDLLADALANDKATTCDLISDLYSRMAAGLERSRGLYRAAFPEIREIARNAGPQSEAGALRREALQILAEIFARGQARGEIVERTPPESLALAFDGLLGVAATSWIHAPPDTSIEPLLDDMRAILIGGVKSRGDET